MTAPTGQLTTRSLVENAVYEALILMCGGGLFSEAASHRHYGHTGEWAAQLKDLARTSVSFPNGNKNSIDGKPHDIEVRAAPTLFYRYAGRKRRLPQDCTKSKEPPPQIILVSDLGLRRTVESPKALSDLLREPLEDFCRKGGLSHDVRPDETGIICIVTPERVQLLRAGGRLPCSVCVKWCKGLCEDVCWLAFERRKLGSYIVLHPI